MDFSFTEEQEKFRKEVQNFLEEEMRKGVFKPRVDAWILSEGGELGRHVAERGWIGITWPKKYGGQGGTYLDRLVFFEEIMRYGAPMDFLSGDRQIGPALIDYGTEEQRSYFLPKIIKHEVHFCLGMSEPEAGSDLTSAKTKAVEEADCFVINGQKTWTSRAHQSDYVYLLAKTNFDPSVPNHRTFSDFIVSLKLPGVTINPVVDMTGGHKWNEVFFDNVRVPKSALVGQRDRGFYQHMSHLEHERSGIERLMANYLLLTGITEYVKQTERNGVPLSKEGWIRHLLSDLLIKFEVGRLLIYRVSWLLDQKDILATDKTAMSKATSIAKAFCTKFEQEVDRAAAKIVGTSGQLVEGSKWAPLDGSVAAALLYSPAHTIQAGTHEILLNIIATRGLGLPTS
jgi:alkylation response protein AidB-like acyl-CoA dehydrogenase